jgi:hypothetical protein
LERRRYRGLADAIGERHDLFPPVFRNDGVTIYGVAR